MNQRFLLLVVTRNSPGVLSRISSLLRRKLFNIDSLTVGRTINPQESRFTIVIEGNQDEARKAALLMERLVEVRSVKVLIPEGCLRREIVLACFQITSEAQNKILHQAENSILSQEISRKGDQVCVELIDTSQKLDVFLEKINMANIKVLDWVRSGVIAMEK